MAKRRHDSISSESAVSESSDSESDEYMARPKASPKKKARKSNPKAKGPSTKAEVTIRATDTPLDKSDGQQRLEKIDSAVIGRIKKALALASHAQTGEDEARAALRMASKLLERHNVTQAEIMSQETEFEQLKRAGTSIVSVKSTVSPTTSVNVEGWTGTLAHAMNTFFDCQSYNTRFRGRHPKVDWTFYGLVEQTVAAAHAFEMTYNLISAWSLMPSVGKGVHAKNCYRMGVATGLHKMAKKEKADDEKNAVKKEQALLKALQEQEAAEDKSREERLKVPETGTIAGPSEAEVKTEESTVEVKSEPDRRVKIEEVEDEDFTGSRPFDEADWMPHTNTEHHDDDVEDRPALRGFDAIAPDFNDSDNEEDLLDLDAANPKLKKSASVRPSLGPMAPPTSITRLAEQKVKEEPEFDSPWSSVGQLVAFRESSIAIGNEYLKTQGVKLAKGRKRKALEFKGSDARRLYQQGKRDAEKIDVRQKRLKDVEMDD
ncbi:hypothetical protein B0H10DRAFT_620695 [Mycena sp. CBHHK59/15]|nr:hypothetical protein B0H10DRAFT_620695 [Mycena sp. CBHHK59/15]